MSQKYSYNLIISHPKSNKCTPQYINMLLFSIIYEKIYLYNINGNAYICITENLKILYYLNISEDTNTKKNINCFSLQTCS